MNTTDRAAAFNAPLEIKPAGDPVPAATSDASALMAVITRAASDPAFDADKCERMLQMYERLKASEAKRAYTVALVAMKPKLPVIDRKGKIVITEKGNKSNVIQSTPYALWEDIDEAITPVLCEYGFALTFKLGLAGDGKITVTGVLSHEGGHSEETTITLPHDSTGSKNAVQAVGSSTSYGKRYTATALLNIRTKGEDDDGKSGGDDENGKITGEHLDKIRLIIERSGADIGEFCALFKVAALPDLKDSDYTRAVEILNRRERRIKAGGQ